MGTVNSNQNNQKIEGTALILNHKTFEQRPSRQTPWQMVTPSERKGTDIDVYKLRKVLTNYGFSIQVETNLTTMQFKDTINQFASRSHIKNECLVIFVLSHGESEGIIHSKDSHYSTSDIWDPFKTCEAFKGKPKLFIFQACRGEKEEKLIHQESTGDNTDENGPCYKLPTLPNIPDFFISYSTVEHRTSKRHISEGSWYIGTICDELNKLKTNEELLHFMTRVTSKVVKKRHFENGQTPVFVSQLNRLLYLPAMQITTNPQNNTADITNDNAYDDNRTEIVSDAVGAMPPVNSEDNSEAVSPTIQIEYPMENQQSTYSIIFYIGKIEDPSGAYQTSATKMEEYLKIIPQINVKLVELSGKKDNISKQIEKVKNDPALQNSNCLLIAIFANLEYIKHTEVVEECHFNVGRASYPTSFAWCPFLASKCNHLLNKPKLFFFLDTNEIEEDAIKISEPRPIPDNYRIPADAVTEHSDFLFVHGYSEKFFKKFNEELRLGVENKTEILHIITNAMRAASSNNHSQDVPLHHIESTLRYELLFPKKVAAKTIEEGKKLTESKQKSFLRKIVYFVTKLIPNFASIQEKCNENNRNIQRDDELKETLKEVYEENKEVKEKAKKQTSELQKLKYENRKLKQIFIANRLLIDNVPQLPNENMIDIFKNICNYVNIPIEDSDIKNIDRQTKNKKSPHPEKILIELNSVEKRNQIISQCKKYKITCKDIGFKSTNRIYINAYLITETYELFQYARNKLKVANGPNFEFVWYTGEGKVLARKSEYSTVYNIKTQEMVDYFVDHPENG